MPVKHELMSMNFADSQLLQVAAGAASRMDLWVKLLRAARVRSVLEVGVWKGDFAKQILQEARIDRAVLHDLTRVNLPIGTNCLTKSRKCLRVLIQKPSKRPRLRLPRSWCFGDDQGSH